MKEEIVMKPSPALDRRTRCYKQAIQEEDRSEQQHQGKKSFFLTLDVEGRPYGPGKKAWIAEVNKLAKGLDLSCTHIRRQAYEDMRILKDRFNDNFEYDGELNEDHLRTILGKGVTRKRTELIALSTRMDSNHAL